MLKYWLCLSVVSSITIAEVIEYHAHPQYSFEYGVNDPNTQDVKKQWETRDGDKVRGSYSFKEADGTVRVVEYHADDHTGFNAVVRREGHAVHPPTQNHVHEPVQTFMHTALHTPIGSVVHTPARTHTIVHTSVSSHNPMETILHTPVHSHKQTPIHSIQNPVHSYVSTTVNAHNPTETIIHTPVHTTLREPVHTFLRPSLSSESPIEAVEHTPVLNTVQHPVHTVLRTSVRSPVHIPVESSVYTYGQTTRHNTKTPVYTVVHNTRKTSVHTPVETTVHVPINQVSVYPEVSTRHKAVNHRKEPEVYNSQIAGAHSASLISAIP